MDNTIVVTEAELEMIFSNWRFDYNNEEIKIEYPSDPDEYGEQASKEFITQLSKIRGIK
jgi:hypothetical protein